MAIPAFSGELTRVTESAPVNEAFSIIASQFLVSAAIVVLLFLLAMLSRQPRSGTPHQKPPGTKPFLLFRSFAALTAFMSPHTRTNEK